MLKALLGRFRLQPQRQPIVDKVQMDHYVSLHQACREHKLISVTVPGSDVLYQSIILSLEPEDQAIFIDQLFPQDFIPAAGQRCKVSIRENSGKLFEFESQIIADHSYDDSPYLSISMPVAANHTQRRDAVRMPLLEPSLVQFNLPDDALCEALAADISATGLQLKIPGMPSTELKPNMTLRQLKMGLNELMLECDVSIKRILLPDENNNVTSVGCEFIGLSRSKERVLEREIIKMQRMGLAG